MPVDKIKVQHKFGIISHNHRQHLLDRITAPPTPSCQRVKSTPCEITHEFISAYNKVPPLEKSKLEIQAYQLLERVKRRAGLLCGGSGKHVHIPRAWVELSLLARCKGKFREDVLNVLVGSLLTAPLSIDNIPSLFLVGETVIEWIKELGNPIPESAWPKTQILTMYSTELCFWRIYHHSLLHNLQACESFLSDLSWHLENLDFVRKVYFKYPDGELLLRHLEGISVIFPKKSSVSGKQQTLTSGILHSLEFYENVKSGSDAASLSSLLTALALLGTEGYLDTVLVMKCFTLIACRNCLTLQIIQAAATGTLPLQTDGNVGVCKGHFQNWDWIIATEYINLLVYVTINGESSEIKKSALKAGQLMSVRVDNAPVQGLGLLDIVAINNTEPLSPAVQYALQQGLTRVHLHVKSDPLRKSATHLIWTSLKTMRDCPSHRIIVEIAHNKSSCLQDINGLIDSTGKLLFEMILESLCEHYIPRAASQHKPAQPAASTTKPPPLPHKPKNNISVISAPGVLTKISSSTQLPYTAHKPLNYGQRNDKVLRNVVADQWYKELMDVFRAAERAQKCVEECEQYSETRETCAETLIQELDITETEVCRVMDELISK